MITGINFVLESGGSISGTVNDSSGPVSYIWVEAWKEGAPGWGGTMTGADGTYTIQGLSAGIYHVEVHFGWGPMGTVISDYACEEKIVTEGRDQGTVVFPDADVKFYLTAETVERARRRQNELRAKGENKRLEQIQRAIEERDKSDESRAAGPLKPAGNAIVVDSTDLSIEEVVEKVLAFVKEKCPKKS